MAARKDYYKILGVDPQCEDRDVKKVLQHPVAASCASQMSLSQGLVWLLHGKAQAFLE